jgi:protein O-GlcNAc transferase
MGLFDRFRSGHKTASTEIASKADVSEQNSLALISEGNALEDAGRFEEALKCYEAAMNQSPSLARAHLNRGNVLLEMGKAEDARDAYAMALTLNPGYAAAHYNLGNANVRMGKYKEAREGYQEAIRLKPEFVDAEVALGYVQENLGRTEDAVASYRRVLEIKPDYAEVHSNLGNALRGMGQFDAAVASYRRALEIAPGFADGYSNLGLTLKDLGQLDAAIASCRRALEINPDLLAARDNLLFTHTCLFDQSATVMFEDAKRYGELVARMARPYTAWSNTPEPGRCLRIGIVSGDLYSHPVGFFMEGVVAALKSQESDRLQLFVYSSHTRFDALSERIKAGCEGWHSAVGLSDESLARRIHEDSIDILIDLAGHTAHNRLPMFAWKPAPVQVSWLGYLATTGVAAIDYLIADLWTLPETEEAYFTEKIWRLPESYICFTPPEVNEDVGTLPALSNGYITFGCFNNLTKMNDAVVALWARVLKAVPDSRLLIKAKQIAETSVRQGVVDRFGVHGVSADRLILMHIVPRAEYLAPYRLVDIALDPFPYQGITTSVEGLWMGVPMLTLAGEHFISRQGVGLLMNSGLPEWIAADADDYVARAVSHAADLQALAALRIGLRQQVLASPIFDAPRFSRYFEEALRGMWVTWCEQQ